MTERGDAFLAEFSQFGYLNHVTTATALYGSSSALAKLPHHTKGASLGAAASALLFGRLASRFGTRAALIPILLGAAVCAAALALAVEWWQLAAGRVLLGLVVGGAPTLVYAAAAHLAGNHRGAAMGVRL